MLVDRRDRRPRDLLTRLCDLLELERMLLELVDGTLRDPADPLQLCNPELVLDDRRHGRPRKRADVFDRADLYWRLADWC